MLIAPLGPLLYRLVFRPLADASVLILLIVAVALHGTDDGVNNQQAHATNRGNSLLQAVQVVGRVEGL